ncbi:hypothetical protein BVY03_04530 [bacterium K02(2017)]|nr:hypothetical protein BVY03_04530 [bacterium K02(2017)]
MPLKKRHKSLTAEFDYNFLISSLKDYAHPRRKINQLLKSGEIIRVKKGLYVYGEKFRTEPPSVLRLSNLIYGPSYISLESALSYYQLIPEYPHQITAITSKRNKSYHTPLGQFVYTYLNPKYYGVGYTIKQDSNGNDFLIATIEKAIIDKIWNDRKNILPHDLKSYLLEDLRMDKTQLIKISLSKLKKISLNYKHETILSLIEFIRDLKNE